MQKGLSAQNLATPSIGGSMNIITDPSSQDRRGLFKQEIGAYGFLKTTLSAHSGLMLDDKLAMSATVVRKTGTGYMQGTWTDAWAYYFDATYNLNDQHRLQFYSKDDLKKLLTGVMPHLRMKKAQAKAMLEYLDAGDDVRKQELQRLLNLLRLVLEWP